MSTLNVESISHPTPGSLVTINGTAPSNRNLIINGAMQVAQRGTSSTADGYIVDRFATYSGGGVSITQSQEVLTSGAPYNEGFRYFLRNTNTSTTANTNSYCQIQHQIEAQNMAQSGWNYTNSNSSITCSFWVRSSLAGTYYVQYRNNDAGDYYFVKSLTVSADTWTKVTHTIPGEASVVFNNDNGSGLQFTLLPHYGSDFTSSSSTVDAWYTQTSTTYAPDFPQNWNNTASATFDLTGVQLEVGSVATPFEHRSYGDELARCQRYYYRHADGADNRFHPVFSGLWYNSGGTDVYGVIHFPVKMRSTPSLAASANGATDAFRAFYQTGSSATDDVGMQAVGTTCCALQVYNLSGGSSAAGDGCWVELNNTGAHISFTAEL